MTYHLLLDEDPVGAVATILSVLMFPDQTHPIPVVQQQEIYSYVTRLKTLSDPDWAGEVQKLKPGYVLVPWERMTFWEGKYQKRLAKALWAGIVAGNLLTAPAHHGRAVSIGSLAEALGAKLGKSGISRTNFTSRVWRPWAPALAACVAYEQIYLQTDEIEARGGLPLWLMHSEGNVRGFVEIARLLEGQLIAHPKTSLSETNCLRLRIA